MGRFGLARCGAGPREFESQRVFSGAVGGSLPQTALGFPVYDTHGNNVGMVSLSGSVAHERTYSPWGEVLSSNGSPPQQGYCANLGHRADAESSLVYMRARYYEPATGRFLTEDPARDGSNWYTYCESEPVGLTDASGKNAYPEFGRWGGVIAAIAAMGFAAANDVTVRFKAVMDLGFLLCWFTFGIRDSWMDGDRGVIGAALTNMMLDIIAVGASWEKVGASIAGSVSPTAKVLALFSEHAAFLFLFMSLEAMAEYG